MIVEISHKIAENSFVEGVNINSIVVEKRHISASSTGLTSIMTKKSDISESSSIANSDSIVSISKGMRLSYIVDICNNAERSVLVAL
jgi:hypothetical protein